jgi:hypothetical protein
MKTPTPAQDALEDFNRLDGNSNKDDSDWIAKHYDTIRLALQSIAHGPHGLLNAIHRIRKLFPTAAFDGAVARAFDDAFDLARQGGNGMHKLTIHVLLDAIAEAARGGPIDPETCATIEGVAREYDHKDFTQEDVQALYDCGPKLTQPPAVEDAEEEDLSLQFALKYWNGYCPHRQQLSKTANEMLDRIIRAASQPRGDEGLDFHPRAAKLMKKKKPFIVVAHDEPYFIDVYAKIRLHELARTRWTNEDEEAYQAVHRAAQKKGE